VVVPRAGAARADHLSGILKVSSAATLVGLQVPSGTRMLELKPYALSGLATDTTVTPRLSNDATNRIGGDLKYGVTQNLRSMSPPTPISRRSRSMSSR
jgi:hypothetical protein